MKVRNSVPLWLSWLACFLVCISGALGGGSHLLRSAETGGKAKAVHVFLGTYARPENKGIFIYRLDPAAGSLKPLGAVGGIANPSFLALHPSHKFLYAVCEVGSFAGKKGGAVSAFSWEPGTGNLKFLNQAPSGGDGPCHITVDRPGKHVLVVNYGGGSVSALRLEADGRLGETTAFIQHEGSSVNPQRQKGPHAHSINLDPANRFAFAADLGLDKILIYRFDAEKGTLAPAKKPWVSLDPGAGPRHFAFHPGGRHAYVINELHSTVTGFRYQEAEGVLEALQTISTLPRGFEGRNSTAEVQVSPCGKFLYGSNRGHDSLAIFAIDQETGLLTLRGHQSTEGKTPRNFGIDPTGRYLLAANQNSNSVVVFRIDPETGILKSTGNRIEVPAPVCVKMVLVPHSK